MTTAQLSRKTAYRIDPLLRRSVQISDEPVLSRINGELPADDFWKQRRKWDARAQKWVWLPMVLLVLLTSLLTTPVHNAEAHHSADAAAASCPTLQEGSTGHAVTELQYRLKASGWVLAVDGQFGSRTKYIVTRFQQMSGLYADGIAGPRTQRALGCGQPAQTPTAPSQPAPASGRPAVEQWRSLALEVGWPADMWPWLSCVIWRESKGIPTVVYRASSDRSYGLMQINALAHSRAMIDFAGSEEAFLDPRVNLSFAYRLFQAAGKSPWRSKSKPC